MPELYDVAELKRRVNILDVIEQTVPLRRSGTTYVGLCPFHVHVHNTPSFVVWPETGTWRCFGQCAEGGDVIAFVMKRDSLSFPEACAKLGANVIENAQPRERIPQRDDAPPGEQWQRTGWRLIERAEHMLWSALGQRALAYLVKDRMLWKDTIKRWRLGFIPEDAYMPLSAWDLPDDPAWSHGLWLPRGIVIPTWTADGALWSLHVRRAAGDPKYPHIAGSKKSLWGSQNVDRRLVFICGGEFDAMLAQQQGAFVGGCCSPSTGEGSAWSITWSQYLLYADVLLVCYDADAPGQNGAWKNVVSATGRAIVATPPVLKDSGKDITDYARSGGSIAKWMMEQREKHIVVHDAPEALLERLKNLQSQSKERPDFYGDLRVDYGLLAGVVLTAPPIVQEPTP